MRTIRTQGFRKRFATVTMGFVFLLLFSSLFFSVEGSLSDELCLRCKGDSMYPTIADEDYVHIQLYVNLSQIKVGDIIVYGSVYAYPCMFIAHRVVEKYSVNGSLFFGTKGDNNPKQDPWQVDGCSIIGIVTCVDHTGHPPEETSQTDPSVYQTPSFPDEEDVSFMLEVSAVAGAFFLSAIAGLIIERLAERFFRRIVKHSRRLLF